MKKYPLNKTSKLNTLLLKPIQRGIAYVVIILILAIMTSLFFYSYNQNKIKESVDEDQFKELDTMISEIQSKLRFSGTPLMLTTENNSLIKVLEDNDEGSKTFMSDVLLSMITNMDYIDQIRILDIDGNERIRVDQNNLGECVIIQENELQNKGERYYFKETLEIDEDDIYIGPMDLNVEYGIIEQPLKPMIRIGKPVRDHSGKVIGGMIINIRGQNILDVLKDHKVHENDNIYLLNSDGYYLSGGEELDFSFMYSDKEQTGFFSEHPYVWSQALTGSNKSIYNSDQYYIKELNPVNGGNVTSQKLKWYIIMTMHKEDLNEAQKIGEKTIRLAALIIVPILLIISYLLGMTQAKNLQYKEEVLKRATYDALTGLYNRGIIMKILHQMMELERRTKKPLAILFIDVNDLKYVNDHVGHTMGDKMLIAAGNSIKNSVRSSDIVARIGGDEFLVILPNCIEEKAIDITDKIAMAFKKESVKYGQKPWSMSYGCAVLQENETENQFIQRADYLMYEDKKAKKAKKL